VVTNFEYRLYPVGPEVVAGAVAWPGDQAEDVLELFRKLAQTAPPELTLVAVLRRAPPAPWLSKEIHGKPIVAVFACHSGPVEQGEKAVAPIKAFGKPVGDILQRRSYVSQQNLLDATQPKGRRYYWKSEFLPGLEPDLMTGFIEHGRRITSPHSAIILFALDGALNHLPEDHNAAGNRRTKAVLNVTSAWESAAEDSANVEWARQGWKALRRFSTGGTYVNFLTEEEGGDRIRDAYGANYERLAELKAKWDPSNLFRTNKNIAPAAGVRA
jgi:hypothetical protein